MTDVRSDRFSQFLRRRAVLDDPCVELDVSQAQLDDAALTGLQERFAQSLAAMAELEAGGIANRDEQRMVGHFWLRAPGLAPQRALEDEIVRTLAAIQEFVTAVHAGRLAPPEGGAFTKVVLCGIGGSALGPLLLADVFWSAHQPMSLTVLDNTDPDGIDRSLDALGSLQDALVLVISKSGGTAETRNGMVELERACKVAGLRFAARAVAVTVPGSALSQRAEQEGWIAQFPMWDWVGGRTSVTSAVGLLPAALLGLDVRALLAGAAAMDDATRRKELQQNPAALLAALWHSQGQGRGARAMVVFPYKDRLLLLSRYLQQLVMESLGKRIDRNGQLVEQGLTVYGNKGSTDQHAFVQQLRDGRHDFFALFVRVLRDRDGDSVLVDGAHTSGDFLDGFYQGTRAALAERGRASATLTIDRIDERSIGALIGLFERAVAMYAEWINVNAFDQPGVEAGKKAATAVLALQGKLLAALTEQGQTVRALAALVGADAADCWPILQHLATNRPSVRARSMHDPEAAQFSRRGAVG